MGTKHAYKEAYKEKLGELRGGTKSSSPLPRPNPKHVDEDLHNISPELLYAKPKNVEPVYKKKKKKNVEPENPFSPTGQRMLPRNSVSIAMTA